MSTAKLRMIVAMHKRMPQESDGHMFQSLDGVVGSGNSGYPKALQRGPHNCRSDHSTSG